MTIGSVIAGIPNAFDVFRLFRIFLVIVTTALALISMMFLIMVRVTDPLLPRAIFGVLNTLLYFPSGAVYPIESFPNWLRQFAIYNPETHAVHALKSVMFKGANFAAISSDVGFLIVFTAIMLVLAGATLKRSL